MAKQPFNEAEQYLLRNWVIATEVEDSLEEVRNKYQTLCEGVAEAVREEHEELDKDIVEVTRTSGVARHGAIVLWKSTWPRDGSYPSGFWINNLRLEILADEDAEPPIAGIWIEENDAWDYEVVEKAVRGAFKLDFCLSRGVMPPG